MRIENEWSGIDFESQFYVIHYKFSGVFLRTTQFKRENAGNNENDMFSFRENILRIITILCNDIDIWTSES